MDWKSLADGLGVADVVDAMSMAFKHRAHVINLDSPNPDRALIGPAATISFMPKRTDEMDDEKHSLGPALYRAVEAYGAAGRVLVMASNGYEHTSLGGGTKLSRVRNLGMAGVLADGMLRDFEELRSYDFAVYCRGETVSAGGNEILPFLTDAPVAFGGVTVFPGDIVFAKGSAAVILPAKSAEAILTKARMIMNKMDAAKTSFVGEDPNQVMSKGSSEL